MLFFSFFVNQILVCLWSHIFLSNIYTFFNLSEDYCVYELHHQPFYLYLNGIVHKLDPNKQEIQGENQTFKPHQLICRITFMDAQDNLNNNEFVQCHVIVAAWHQESSCITACCKSLWPERQEDLTWIDKRVKWLLHGWSRGAGEESVLAFKIVRPKRLRSSHWRVRVQAEFRGPAKCTEGNHETTKEGQQRMQKLACGASFTLVFLQLGMLAVEEGIRLKRMRWKLLHPLPPPPPPHMLFDLSKETSCSWDCGVHCWVDEEKTKSHESITVSAGNKNMFPPEVCYMQNKLLVAVEQNRPWSNPKLIVRQNLWVLIKKKKKNRIQIKTWCQQSTFLTEDNNDFPSSATYKRWCTQSISDMEETCKIKEFNC